MIIFQNWQELFRSFLTAEIESDCLLPDGNLQDFIVHLEWIALEYTAIKQFLFLDWIQNGSLTYEKDTRHNHVSLSYDRI